jgi:hypothetical protein
MTSPTRPFIDALRPICEIIFDLLLSGYISSLEAFHNYFVRKNTRKGQQWEKAISAAVRALQDFRRAERKCQAQLINEANFIVKKAMRSLKYRYRLLISSSIVSNYLLYNVVWMQFLFFTDQT